MSKTAQIRAALADGPLAKDVLEQRVGFALPLSPSQYASDIGHVLIEGQKFWTVIAATDTAPAKRQRIKRPRRLKGFKAEAREKARKARKVKSYKQLRRTLQKPASPALHDLARDNYLRVSKLLIDAVKQRCEGLDEDEVIGPLLTMHELASTMHQAASA